MNFRVIFSFPFELLFLKKFYRIEVYRNYSINRKHEKKSLHEIRQEYTYLKGGPLVFISTDPVPV